jgi:hypothetical protein
LIILEEYLKNKMEVSSLISGGHMDEVEIQGDFYIKKTKKKEFEFYSGLED